jgi:plasmid maintenance system antidote protein VapI
MPKLTVAQVVAIRQLWAEGWTEKELAEQFEVHPRTIFKVVNNCSWVGI